VPTKGRYNKCSTFTATEALLLPAHVTRVSGTASLYTCTSKTLPNTYNSFGHEFKTYLF